MKTDDKRHGTAAGYTAHRRADQTPCRPCIDAANAANRAWKSRRAIPEAELTLTDGRWVPSGGIVRWVSNEPLTFQEVRRLHAAFNRGDRSHAAVDGERTYQRLMKRYQRARSAA